MRLSRWSSLALAAAALFAPVAALAQGAATPAPAPAPLPLAGLSKEMLPEGWTLYGTDRLRWEKWNAFESETGGDGDYDFTANQLRLGLKADRPTWGFHVAGQYTRLWSLPDDANAAPMTVGTGPLYYIHAARASSGHTNGREDTWDVYVKYLNASLKNIGDSGLGLTVGRMGYDSAMETLSGNPKIDWIKRARLNARMIGEFGWSHFQRSFDGARVTWDAEPGQLSLAGFRVTQGGFADDANKSMQDLEVMAAAWTSKVGKILPWGETQLFAYKFNDDRSVSTRPDNSGLGATRGQNIDVQTFGAHWAAAHPCGAFECDFMVWGAWQHGNWFAQSHHAAAYALETGFQMKETPWKPWFRIGWNWSSGDDSVNDSKHGTFYQMVPTARIYSFTTAYNLMNNTDAFVQVMLAPTPKTNVRADLHKIWLTDEDDMWYAGAGPTLSTSPINGYTTRASGSDDSLGTVVELTVSHQFTPMVGVELYYGHMMGNDVVDNLFNKSDDLDFFLAEVRLSF